MGRTGNKIQDLQDRVAILDKGVQKLIALTALQNQEIDNLKGAVIELAEQQHSHPEGE